MVQIINKPGFGELLGTSLGSGLSKGLETGLGQGLQLLVNQRMQDLAQRNLRQRLTQGLEPFYGEQAAAYANLPESTINTLLKEKVREPLYKSEAELIKQLFPQGQVQTTTEGGAVAAPTEAGVPVTAAEQISPALARPGKALEIAKFRQQAQQHKEAQELKKQIHKEKQQLAERKLGTQEKQIQRTNEAELVKNYLNPLREKYETSKRNIEDYKNLIKIAKTPGALRNQTAQTVLQRVGLGDLWASTGQQLASTIINGLTTGAGSAFNTSRLTNLDVNLYKNSLARLTNTPEAIEAISKNEILGNEANVAQYKAAAEILKKNPTITPLQFELEFEEKVEPKLKELAEQTQRNIDDVLAMQQGLSEEMETLPSPNQTKGEKFYVSELGTQLTSDGTNYYDSNGNLFDWQSYNKGAK
jgi:hypothetical protein